MSPPPAFATLLDTFAFAKVPARCYGHLPRLRGFRRAQGRRVMAWPQS